MRIEEAIVYLLASEGHGMTTDTLAKKINLRRLHLRCDWAAGYQQSGLCRRDEFSGDVCEGWEVD